jgi:6-phosphogluconolactonase
LCYGRTGKDGHIGSLYPGRNEALVTFPEVLFAKAFALGVTKKEPASITLALPVMNHAKEIRVVLVGEDKADAAVHGIKKDLPVKDFPVCGVDDSAVWFLDKPSASKLGL